MSSCLESSQCSACHVGGAHDAHFKCQAVERTASQVVGGTATSPLVGGVTQRVSKNVSESNVATPKQTKTRAGVQAKAVSTAVHVGASNQQTEARVGVQAKCEPSAVHVGNANEIQAANETQAANEIQPRVVHVVTAIQETRLRTRDHDRIQANRDMADVAVVEHPHPHEDEEHVEWDRPDKVTWTERTKRIRIRGRSEQMLNVK